MAVLLLACGRNALRPKEIAYVSAQQATLRDRLANVYNKTGTVTNGEQVEILETRKRFARVRSVRGEEGWVEQRYLVSAEMFESFTKLAKDNAAVPAQAVGITRDSLNIHLTPDRDAEHLYQLRNGERVDILKRTTAEKPQPKIAVKPGDKELPKVLEDWWLVRDAQKRAGWVVASMVDIDAPLDVAQYAEGQRIVGCFMLNQVQDGGRQVPQYLMLLTEPKDGLPYDYNQARIFTWNLKRHRYETADRVRKIAGFFPTKVGHANFGNEGNLPTFTLHTQDEKGQFVDRQYKLSGPIVRRVLSPAEQAKADAEKAARAPASRKRLPSAGR